MDLNLEICDNQLNECRPKTLEGIQRTLMMTFYWLLGDFDVETDIEKSSLYIFLYIIFLANLFFMNLIMLNFLIAIMSDTFQNINSLGEELYYLEKGDQIR